MLLDSLSHVLSINQRTALTRKHTRQRRAAAEIAFYRFVVAYLNRPKGARLNTFKASNAAFAINRHYAIAIFCNRTRFADLDTLWELAVNARYKMQFAMAMYNREPRERARILVDCCVNIT
ncbi:MAG: hypothetical protein LUP95_06775 [Euryarchaeota archaeon]|nr:hypothetical protein [Euryarchaeota archaeon]